MMCGPLVLQTSPKSVERYLYHIGRLLAYLSLGALAGALGGWLFLETFTPILAILTAGFLSLIFLWNGIQLWTGSSAFSPLQKIHRWFWNGRVARRQNRQMQSFLMGISSGILPCGWLYSFVLAALATQNILLGALVLFFFWLGTLPALMSLAWGVKKIFSPLRQKAPRLTATAFILTGLLILPLKLFPLFSSATPPSSLLCHPIHSQIP